MKNKMTKDKILNFMKTKITKKTAIFILFAVTLVASACVVSAISDGDMANVTNVAQAETKKTDKTTAKADAGTEVTSVKAEKNTNSSSAKNASNKKSKASSSKKTSKSNCKHDDNYYYVIGVCQKCGAKNPEADKVHDCAIDGHEWVTVEEEVETDPVWAPISSHEAYECNHCRTVYETVDEAWACPCNKTHGWCNTVVADYGWLEGTELVTYTKCGWCGATK